MASLLRRPLTAGALVVLLAAAGTTGAIAAADRPEAIDAWEIPAASDGLTRAVVTLRTEAPAAVASTTSGSVLPVALLAAPPSGRLPQLDVDKHARARAELGAAGELVLGAVDGAPATLYVADGRARVVSTGPAWEVPAPAAAAGPAQTVALATDDALAQLRAAEGVRDVQDLGDGSYLVTADLTLAQVAALPAVERALPSTEVPVFGAPVSAVAVPDDASFGAAWQLHNTGRAAYQQATAGADVSALEGWEATRGAGAVIAVLDTGFDTDHPDLTGALWANPAQPCGAGDADGNGLAGDCHGWNYYSGTADLDNGGGSGASHGTAVAGTAAARVGNGVGAAGLAPAAQVMPLVIGRGNTVNMELASIAIRYAADHGADVVNASFGGPVSGPPLARLRAAVQYAETRDVLVVAAAGNAASDIDAVPTYPASLTEPNVITAGSSTATDAVAAHSNTGAVGVDLFAPGLHVYTTHNEGNWAYYSGTSFAAPMVAGAAALHRSLDPTSTAASLRTELMDAATRLPAFAGRSASGGRLSTESLATAGLRYEVSGLGAQPSGSTVTGRVRITAARPAADGPPDRAEVSLITRHQGEVWAVTGARLTVGGQALTTDADGTASVALTGADLSAGVVLDPSLSLPDGQYALVVQLFAGRTPLGPARAAPLTLGVAPVPPPVTAPPPATGSPTASATGPATAAPTSAAPTGGSTPTSTATAGPSRSTPTTAPSTAPPTAAPTAGPTTAPATRPTASASPTSGTPTASSSTSSTAGPSPSASTSTAPPAPAPAAPSPTATPSTSAPRGTAGPTTAPTGASPTATGTAAPAPGVGYPGTGAFGVTRVTPSVVPTAGQVQVRIEGTAIPDDVVVLVGGTATAQVVSVTRGSGGRAVVVVPARAAGTYDVLLSSRGASELLAGALTYEAPGGSTAAPTPGTPTAAPTSTATPTSGTASPSSTTAPAPPDSVELDNGLVLRRSTRWGGVPASVWSLGGCETSCAGAQV